LLDIHVAPWLNSWLCTRPEGMYMYMRCSVVQCRAKWAFSRNVHGHMYVHVHNHGLSVFTALGSLVLTAQ
jgi:hypothetical protein